MNEIWKDVEGYDGLYQVSNFGNVRKRRKDGTFKSIKGSSDPSVYKSVSLSMNGKGKSTFVHRLVAMAFVPGYFEGAVVNHINGNKQDNRPQNLEWCTYQYNSRYSVAKMFDKKYRNEELLKYLGRRVSELRNEKGWSKVKLGKISGIGCSIVSAIEAGRYHFQIEMLNKIAKALGKRVDIV